MRWVALLLVALLVAGCARDPTGTTPTPSPSTPVVTTPAPTLAFDGERAYANVVAQVTTPNGSARYRIPGTPGNDEVAHSIDGTLTALGYHVTWHHFNATYGCEQVAMHNLVADRAGTSGELVVFAAHYDSRPVADKDPDPANKALPVLGANDGASGVGLLLELARVLPPSDDAVRFLFFDGEDGGGYKASEGCRTDWILGSRAYAATLSPDELASIRAFVLVDMIGDPELTLLKEGYTLDDPRSADVQADIYATAKSLGNEQFVDRPGPQILDDHVPVLDRNVPAVDLIHLLPSAPTFPAWHHTLDDDLDVVGADTLDAVGETLEAWFSSTAAG